MRRDSTKIITSFCFHCLVSIAIVILFSYEGKCQTMSNWNDKAVSEADIYTAKCLITGTYELPGYSDKEIKEVFDRLLTYANNGHVESMYYVAFMYQNFGSVGKDYDKAFYWYQKAADLGHEPSIQAVATAYLFGKNGGYCNTPIDFHKAEKMLLIIAEKGDVDALNDLGYLYHMGCSKNDKFDETEDDFPADLNKSLLMYTKAADKGSALAMYHLGELYKDVFHDAEKSLEWYERAIKNGSHEAAEAMGYLFFYGDENLRSFPVHVDVDYKKALGYFNKELELCTYQFDAEHAKEHIAETCFYLGRMYYYGDGCAKDFSEAVKWCRLTAEQGYKEAVESLDVWTR